MDTEPISLTLKPVPRTNINSAILADLFDLSLDFVRTIPSSFSKAEDEKLGGESSIPRLNGVKWKASKRDSHIKLFQATYENETWLARVMETTLSYDLVRHCLTDSRAETECALTGSPNDKCEMLTEELLEDGNFKVQDIRKLVTIPGFSSRVFLQTVAHQDLPPDSFARRSFAVVAFPTEAELQSKSEVRGWYTAVEYVREFEDGLEYVMVLSSNAGGAIPRWVQNVALSGQVMSAGKSFVEYVKKRAVDKAMA